MDGMRLRRRVGMGSLGLKPKEKGGDGAHICRNGDGECHGNEAAVPGK